MDNTNIFDDLAEHEEEDGLQQALREQEESQMQQQQQQQHLTQCSSSEASVSQTISLGDVRLLEVKDGLPSAPPLYSISPDQLFKTRRERELVCAMLEESAGKCTSDIGYAMYLELAEAYRSTYDLDSTTFTLFESILCYLPLFPTRASDLLVDEIYKIFSKVGQDTFDRRCPSKSEIEEQRKRRFHLMAEKFTKTKVLKANHASTPTTTEQECELIQPDYLTLLFDKISAFLKLGTLFKDVVPVRFATIERVSVSDDEIPDLKGGNNKVTSLRVKFKLPILFQLVGRKNDQIKIASQPNMPAHFVTITKEESTALIELLKAKIYPCSLMQFHEQVTVCRTKKAGMKQLCAFRLPKGKHFGQSQMPSKLEATELAVDRVYDENNTSPYFIFISDAQIYCKKSESPSLPSRFIVRIFPRPLKHLDESIFVLSFDEYRNTSDFEEFQRLTTVGDTQA